MQISAMHTFSTPVAVGTFGACSISLPAELNETPGYHKQAPACLWYPGVSFHILLPAKSGYCHSVRKRIKNILNNKKLLRNYKQIVTIDVDYCGILIKIQYVDLSRCNNPHQLFRQSRLIHASKTNTLTEQGRKGETSRRIRMFEVG